MALREAIVGHRVILRCVEPSDAEFTLDIRNDSELTKFIPRVNGSLAQQIAWIERQREKVNDYFFLIERHKGPPLGTLAYYNIDLTLGSCEVGRYISRGTSFENVEAVMLLLDAVFFDLGLEMVVLNHDERNKKIVSFWKKFGAEFQCLLPMSSWTAAQYSLRRFQYEKKREKIVSLLNR